MINRLYSLSAMALLAIGCSAFPSHYEASPVTERAARGIHHYRSKVLSPDLE